MKKLVISTGAGISAESGLSTFRDAGGLWEQYPVMQVASADGFRRDPALIHRFYNDRRKQLVNSEPNAAHYGLKELEKDFDVWIITQNVDDLHERAGSSHVLHLHGELMKVRSIKNPNHIYDIRDVTGGSLETSVDTTDKYGDHVRPHIVFFQEPVPNFEAAAVLASNADIFVVIGTSFAVYPAAGLVSYVGKGVPIYYIDPNPAPTGMLPVTVIKKTATEGVKELIGILRNSK